VLKEDSGDDDHRRRCVDDAKREDAEDEGDAESLLVMSLKATLEQHDVPADVADNVIGPIEEWEKTSTTKS
jgi:hypothetical protein